MQTTRRRWQMTREGRHVAAGCDEREAAARIWLEYLPGWIRDDESVVPHGPTASWLAATTALPPVLFWMTNCKRRPT